MIFSVKNLGFSYGGRNVFRGISFSVSDGEVLCLLGPNGAGKSTLIKCLAGIFTPEEGETVIDGKKAAAMKRREFARKVAYIPQSAAPVFPLPVRELAAMGRAPYKKFLEHPDARDYEKVSAALESLGISHLEDKYCTELSGGERQMVLFASALVQEPELLLLDEPTSHLDFGNQIKLLKTVKALAAEKGIGVIMATHAPEHAFLVGTKAAIFRGGVMTEWGTPESVLTEPAINAAFGVRVKVIDVDGERNIKSCAVLMD